MAIPSVVTSTGDGERLREFCLSVSVFLSVLNNVVRFMKLFRFLGCSLSLFLYARGKKISERLYANAKDIFFFQKIDGFSGEELSSCLSVRDLKLVCVLKTNRKSPRDYKLSTFIRVIGLFESAAV